MCVCAHSHTRTHTHTQPVTNSARLCSQSFCPPSHVWRSFSSMISQAGKFYLTRVAPAAIISRIVNASCRHHYWESCREGPEFGSLPKVPFCRALSSLHWPDLMIETFWPNLPKGFLIVHHWGVQNQKLQHFPTPHPNPFHLTPPLSPSLFGWTAPCT